MCEVVVVNNNCIKIDYNNQTNKQTKKKSIETTDKPFLYSVTASAFTLWFVANLRVKKKGIYILKKKESIYLIKE